MLGAWRNDDFAHKIFKNNKNFKSKPEKKMKRILKSLGVEFTHQKYVRDIEHSYWADFYLPNENLIIEVDGIYYHANSKYYPDRENLHERQKKKVELDKFRTKELKEKGYKVLRFWENEFDECIVKKRLEEISGGS
jgi:very-short-patch-repair endonuclease